MIRRINPPSLYDGSAAGMSQASVDTSGLVFLSGQVAWDKHARIVGLTYAEQARNAFANLDLALEDAGSDLQHVLHIRLYVRGEVAEHLAELTPILAERLGGVRPALTAIGVASLATPDTLVEIEAVARVRDDVSRHECPNGFIRARAGMRSFYSRSPAWVWSSPPSNAREHPGEEPPTVLR